MHVCRSFTLGGGSRPSALARGCGGGAPAAGGSAARSGHGRCVVAFVSVGRRNAARRRRHGRRCGGTTCMQPAPGAGGHLRGAPNRKGVSLQPGWWTAVADRLPGDRQPRQRRQATSARHPGRPTRPSDTSSANRVRSCRKLRAVAEGPFRRPPSRPFRCRRSDRSARRTSRLTSNLRRRSSLAAGPFDRIPSPWSSRTRRAAQRPRRRCQRGFRGAVTANHTRPRTARARTISHQGFRSTMWSSKRVTVSP